MAKFDDGRIQGVGYFGSGRGRAVSERPPEARHIHSTPVYGTQRTSFGPDVRMRISSASLHAATPTGIPPSYEDHDEDPEVMAQALMSLPTFVTESQSHHRDDEAPSIVPTGEELVPATPSQRGSTDWEAQFDQMW